jgi:leucyl aminopeptidase
MTNPRPGDVAVPRFLAPAAVPAEAQVLGVPVFEDLSVPAGAGAELDTAFLSQRRFEGKPGQAQALPADDGTTVVALGVGPAGSVGPDELRRAAAALARHAGRAGHVATTLVAAGAGPGAVTAMVEGLGLASYRYERAPQRRRSAAEGAAEAFSLVGADGAEVRRAAVAVRATWRARDWVNRPPRDLTPKELARLAADVAASAGLAVEVWDEARIARERLGGLLAVASGASEPPRLVRLEHRGRRGAPTVHLVGKGITFDSGGLSLKPPASMMTMKCDMGGAAAVVNAAVAAGELRLPVNVVAWAAATENMPSGTAIHPGDVFTARNGKTVEVLNTDAEGRLILADALSLAVEEGADAIIDVATLTGAQRVALGDGVAAVLGRDPELVRRVVEAGAASGEPFWELPLHSGYRKQLDSEVADLKNVSSVPAAGTIIAALFLAEFTGDRPWAHLDIAAPAFVDFEDGWLTRGATGWGTRTLIELLRTWPA